MDTLWRGGGKYPIASANNQHAHTMPQLLFAGFPKGAIRIGLTLNILKKEGCTTVITTLLHPSGLSCKHHLLWMGNAPVFNCAVRAVNVGKQPVTLEMLTSFMITDQPADIPRKAELLFRPPPIQSASARKAPASPGLNGLAPPGTLSEAHGIRDSST